MRTLGDQYEASLQRTLHDFERSVRVRNLAESQRLEFMEAGAELARLDLESRRNGTHTNNKLRDITRFMEVCHRIAMDTERIVYRAITPMKDYERVGVPIHRIPSLVELVTRMPLPEERVVQHAQAVLRRLPIAEQIVFADAVLAVKGPEFMDKVGWEPPLELEPADVIEEGDD